MGCIPKLLFDGFDKLLRLGFTSYLFLGTDKARLFDDYFVEIIPADSIQVVYLHPHFCLIILLL